MAYLESLPRRDPGSDSYGNSLMRRELEPIGLSESIITTAEHGLYTADQLEKLKIAKSELNRIVADALHAAHMKTIAVKVSVNAQYEPPNTDGTLYSVSEPQEEVGCT